MELAHCILALGGDKSMTVPKFNVTPAEIAVLMAIHGEDAVFDIQPTGEKVKRSNADEMDRLYAAYPAKDADGKPMIQSVYPGKMPIIHKKLTDLGLDSSLFLATQRATPETFEDSEPTVDSEPEAAAAEDEGDLFSEMEKA